MAPPNTRRDEIRQALGKQTPWTRRSQTAEPAHVDVQHDAAAAQREIGHPSSIAGVHPCGPALAEWAPGVAPFDRNGERDRAGIETNAFKRQGA
jgi:hypothetical protein